MPFLRIEKRENTGVGVYVYFRYLGEPPRASAENRTLGQSVYAEIEGLEGGGGWLYIIRRWRANNYVGMLQPLLRRLAFPYFKIPYSRFMIPLLIEELGYAGFQSAYYRDISYCRNEWSQSWRTLSNVGKALWNDPLGMIVPGIMDAWRNPTSPAAWGKAAVDIGLIGLSAAKIGSAARLSRVGEELSALSRSRNIVEKVISIDSPIVKTVNLETSWCYGAFKSEIKWTNQMVKRGWSSEQVTEAITKGRSYAAINMINKSNSATRYVHPVTGQSVVIDNRTKEILHIGGPGFKY